MVKDYLCRRCLDRKDDNGNSKESSVHAMSKMVYFNDKKRFYEVRFTCEFCGFSFKERLI